MARATGPTPNVKLAASAAPPGPASSVAGSCGVNETSLKPGRPAPFVSLSVRLQTEKTKLHSLARISKMKYFSFFYMPWASVAFQKGTINGSVHRASCRRPLRSARPHSLPLQSPIRRLKPKHRRRWQQPRRQWHRPSRRPRPLRQRHRRHPAEPTAPPAPEIAGKS